MRAENDYKLPNEVKFNKHIHRKNNDIVAAMYAMYCTGKSIRKIAEVYHKTHQAVYDTFHSRHYPLRSKQLKGLQILDGVSFTVDGNGYLRGTIGKRRISGQRYVWEKANGPVPTGFVLYFKDKNKTNVAIENLGLVSLLEMSKKFNPKANNQYTKHENIKHQ